MAESGLSLKRKDILAMRRVVQCAIILFLLTMITGTVSAGQGPSALKVALYPYIDDVNGDSHIATIALLEKKYHERYPDDELEIFISPDYSTYLENSNNLSATFGPGGPDIVEVEQTVLDNLIAGGYIRPFTAGSDAAEKQLADNRIHVVDRYENIGIINGKVFFVPTWLCAEYTFLRNPAGDRLESGDFSDKWMLPDLYLSAYAQTYGSDPDLLQGAVRDAIAGSPDPVVIDWLSTRFSACTNKSGENRCLNGYYSGDNDGTDDFGAGNTDRYVGFSEMLYWILKVHPGVYAENITISGTLLGKEQYPSLAWVDGFVLNNNTGPEKTDQAIRFIDFYNSPEVKEIIALSFDVNDDSDRVPRYLLPATEDFYILPNVSADPYYRQFYPVIQNMTPFPNGGLRGNMNAVYCSVTSALYREGMDVNGTEFRYACAGPSSRNRLFPFEYRSHTGKVICPSCCNQVLSRRLCLFGHYTIDARTIIPL